MYVLETWKQKGLLSFSPVFCNTEAMKSSFRDDDVLVEVLDEISAKLTGRVMSLPCEQSSAVVTPVIDISKALGGNLYLQKTVSLVNLLHDT